MRSRPRLATRTAKVGRQRQKVDRRSDSCNARRMRRALVALAVSAILAVVFGCGTAPPSACGNETCGGDQICLQQCHDDKCAMTMPADGQCPSGYVALTGSDGVCCAHAAPAPHCVIPSAATQADCAPYGQLEVVPANGDAPPVACVCPV